MTVVYDTPAWVTTPLTDLLGCLCTEVNAIQPVCDCSILPGNEVAWDYCGECTDEGKCGQAWVRMVRVFPWSVWPEPSVDANCTLPLAMEVELGVVRCLPTLSEGGDLPPIGDIESSSMLQVADMWAMYRAVTCCSASLKTAFNYDAVGPLGGCVGGVWSAYLSLE